MPSKKYSPKRLARYARALSVPVAHRDDCKCVSCVTVARTVYPHRLTIGA